MNTNTIYCGECAQVMKENIDDNSIDLTVTSPPYDNLRKYNGFVFPFEEIAKELFRVTKQGGVVVWVVADETKQFCESLTSFKQAIYFVEACGFNLLDTMIYHKTNYAPAYPSIKRYANTFEYMFILSKGKPSTFNPIQVQNKLGGYTDKRSYFRHADGSQTLKIISNDRKTKDAENVWDVCPTKAKDAENHAGVFPEKLAEDHILSWSNENDIVFDPMCGSGTTLKMAKKHNRRYIGIDISQEYVDLSNRRVNTLDTA